jgi:hypothetical protein
MYESTQIQFKLLGREARSAALRRLALRGASVQDMATQTGLSAEEIRSCLGVEAEPLTESAARYWRRSHTGSAEALYRQ